MAKRRGPFIRFEVRFLCGMPEEGECYPVHFWFGINVEDFATDIRRFFTVETAWFEITFGKTYQFRVDDGPPFVRLVVGRHRWGRTLKGWNPKGWEPLYG